jgi:hypothetical protein
MEYLATIKTVLGAHWNPNAVMRHFDPTGVLVWNPTGIRYSLISLAVNSNGSITKPGQRGDAASPTSTQSPEET